MTTISPRSPRDRYLGAGDLTHREVKKDVANKKARTKIRLKILLSSKEDYRYRKDEIFKRMKVSTFVQLVLQVHSITREEQNTRLRNISEETPRPQSEDISLNGGGGDGRSPVPSLALTEGDYGAASEVSSPRSTLQSVIRGVGEFDLEQDYVPDPTPRSDAPEPDNDCPYLLLDLRDQDTYDQCHIISAENYPTAMLSRAVNNYTKNILSYRNKTGKIIVIYDEDERIATTAATTFVERGFDNIFLLSGGLKVAAQKFPEGLITGTLPPSCRPPPPPSRTKKVKVKTPPQVPASKTGFSPDDMEKLQSLLDESLIPRDTGSRLSRATPRSKSTADPNATILSSRSSTSMTTSSVHSQPWK